VKEDPSPKLEAAFRRIERERMQGVPMRNPALQVEAVGFCRWHEGWLGMLVTPWFVNAVIVPDEPQAAREGEPIPRALPGGTFAFLRGDEPEVGAYESCGLCTRTDAFATHVEARQFAQESLSLLLRAPSAPMPPAPLPVTKRQFLGALLARPR
jgi:[NiFe] hydrogenase assembly HybE family chaperone